MKIVETSETSTTETGGKPAFPRSVPELSAYFLKGESWVKYSKKVLKEAFFWGVPQLIDKNGSLTETGFERMTELFDLTSNTEVVLKRGKRVSVRRPARMTIEEYKQKVWRDNGKFPPGAEYSDLIDPDTDPDTDRDADRVEDEVITVELLEAELPAIDAAAQHEQNSDLVLKNGQLVQAQNSAVFRAALSNLTGLIAAQVEGAIIQGVVVGQNRGVTQAAQVITTTLQEDVTPVQVKRTKKPAAKKD